MLWRLRRYIRRNTKPIPQEQARLYKYRLSLMYAIVGWNMFAFVLYTVMKKNFPKESTAADFAKLLNVKNATVVKYDGLNKIEEYELYNKDQFRHVDYFSEIMGEDIQYYKYLNDEEEEENEN